MGEGQRIELSSRRSPGFQIRSHHHQQDLPKWRIATEFNCHPEGALVFETSRRTSAVRSKFTAPVNICCTVNMAESTGVKPDTFRYSPLSKRVSDRLSLLSIDYLYIVNTTSVDYLKMAESEGFDPPCPKNGQPLFSKQAQYRALSTLQTYGWWAK